MPQPPRSPKRAGARDTIFGWFARNGAGLTTFELDGERAAASTAYGDAGRVVLNQSDLLIAVWDGGKPEGTGGTVETLQQTVRFHVPVLWIDAQAPHRWQPLHDVDDLACLEGRDRCVPSGEHPTVPSAARKRIGEGVQPIVLQEVGPPSRTRMRPTPRRPRPRRPSVSGNAGHG